MTPIQGQKASEGLQVIIPASWELAFLQSITGPRGLVGMPPSVFLSYAHADLTKAQELERELRTQGVSVWRDQERLYAGQRWPKALGEAIAASDVLLLLWSENAAASAFVELEWTTAVALKKPVLPCLLDATPLPPTLTSVQAVRRDGAPEAILRALNAAKTAPSGADPGRRREVVEALGSISPGPPDDVASAAREILTRHNWTVAGNVYQAAGDIHITTVAQADATAGTGLKRWQTWVALIAGFLGIAGWLLDVPGKLAPYVEALRKAERVTVQPLAGSIRDENGEPLSGVRVFLPAFNVAATTDELGYFRLQVEAPHQSQVELVARKDGYPTSERYVTLGNTALSFTMRRKTSP